jgi:hypothetical protein
LAGKAAADDIDQAAVEPWLSGRPHLFARGVGNISRGELPDVSPNRDIWPVPSQHPLAIGVDLAETDGSHSGPLEPEAEPANA